MSTENQRIIKLISFKAYCENRTFKRNLGFKMKEDKGYYVDGNGTETLASEIDELFPTPLKLFSRENVGGTINRD